jgi:hypothetical protein
MMKKITTVAAFVAIIALLLGSAVFACGKECPMKAANKGCAMGATDPHMQAMDKAFAALEADLAKLDKGVPAADEAAFLKGTQANLKALMDGKAECEKACKAHADKDAKAEKAADKPCCAHQKDMQAGMKTLGDDLAKMDKGVPAADQAAFLKAYHADLKMVVEARAACMKECKTKAAAKSDKT